MSTYLYEGQTVSWIGDETPAHGHIIAVAGKSSAHVKWASGPNAGDVTLTDLYDLAPVVAGHIDEAEDPMHLTAVRKVYDLDGEAGVLNFLASHEYLDTWRKIAADALEYVEERIRVDASMELVEEQLSPTERNLVVQAAALTLLRDAFGIEEE